MTSSARSKGFVATLFVVACAGTEPAPPALPPASIVAATSTSARPQAKPPPTPEPQQEPLTADGPFVELPLPKAKPVVVSLPLGSTGPRPVLVATHGAGGRATVHCALWRGIIGDRGFILCPRGVAMYPYEPPHESGYFYDGHPALAVEISKAIAALVDAYGDRVDLERPIFAGYSQGANMGALILPSHEARFGSAVLWEGGVGENQEWNIRTAQRFFERGARRVLLACGRADCYKAAQLTASYMKRGGLEPRTVYVPSAGHTYAGEIGQRVREHFVWLIEDDPRWSP